MIQTVAGTISPEELGVTSSHEHVFCDNRCYSGDDWKEPGNEWMSRPMRMEDLGKIRYQPHKHLDNAVLNDPEAAAGELSEFRKAGGRTIIDCTSIGIDRRPETLREVSEKTGVQIVLGTGAYLEIAMPEEIRNAGVEDLAELYEKELTEGIGDTGIRAGLVGEIGISERFTEAETRNLRAGARAAAKTDRAILIHQPGLEHENLHILDVIESEGCPASRVILSHNDPLWDQPDYLRPALERGAYLCFDTFGLEFVLNYTIPFPRDWDRLETVRRFIEEGYGKQILFGQDTCFKIQYLRYGGCGYRHLLREVRLLAKNMGYEDAWLEDIFVNNPARVFSGREL